MSLLGAIGLEFASAMRRLARFASGSVRAARQREMADLQRLRAAIDASGDAIFLVDVEDLRFVDVNAAAERLLGYTRSELLRLGPDDIRPRGSGDIRASYAQLIASGAEGRPFETQLQRKDGSALPVEAQRRPLLSSGRWYVIGACRNLTDVKRAVHDLQLSEARYRNLFDFNPLPVWVYDLETYAFLEVNQAAIEQYGYSREEFLAMTILDIRPEHDVAQLQADVRVAGVKTVRAGADGYGVRRHRRRNGAIIDVEVSSQPVDFCGHTARLVLAHDVTARVAAEVALRSSNERFEFVARATNDIVWDWDLATDERWWSPNITPVLGYERGSLVSGPAYWGVHPDDLERVSASVRAAAGSNAHAWSAEYRFRHARGHYVDIHDRGFVQRDGAGAAVRMIGAMMDITERKRAEAEVTRHLTHDVTTGLPRFALIETYLQSALSAAAACDGRVVVLYVDLDYFHGINETRGRAVGDFVLRATAERLIELAGADGKVAHVAGDEFAVILTDNDGRRDQVELAESVRACLARPLDTGDQTIFVTASIGVSCFPDNSASAGELLRQAEAAMMRSKREGRNTISAFSNDQNAELQVRLALGSRLHTAIRDRRLTLHYQPQISGQNWQIVGFEALARWQDPDLGSVMPSVFVQAAEELGLIVELGRFVLFEACRQVRAWIDGGAGAFTVAVNLSAIQLQQPGLVADVRAALAEFRVPPRCIELELTESVMLQNVDRTVDTLHALKKLGVRLSLDDFGIGHSSLNHLRRFPIDALKIDQSFVREVNTDVGSAGICRALITLGHQLGMTVVAEGVETAAQVGYLKRIDCDAFQGFYFSPAVKAERAFEMLSHRYLAHEAIANDDVHSLLLVDDEVNILKALTRALRRDGYRILTATNADEALEILGREDVHVIVSDQRMPGISGTELLSKVKEMHPDTVRLVLSGYTDLAAVTQAINQGAIYKFLTKPWDDEELRLQIRDAFRKHEAERPNARRSTGGAEAPA